MDEIAPWLNKRAKGDKCFSTKYTEEQFAELKTIISFYGALCWQYEHPGKVYPLYFQLSEKQSTQFYEEGFCPVTEFLSWQNYLNNQSPFYNALKSILAHLCSAQLSVIERLNQKGHHFDPATMLFEELKVWAIEFSYVQVSKEAQLREKLNTRKLFLTEIISADKLLASVPEYTEALSKCMTIIDREMMPCLQATLAQGEVSPVFLAFKENSRVLFKHLIFFLFHLFRNTEFQKKECAISDLQDPSLRELHPVGKECESTFSGKILLKLITATETVEVFLDDGEKSKGCYFSCENCFVNEEGAVIVPKELVSSGGRNLVDVSVGILSIFKQDPDVMQQFIYLHALTQRMALFFVIFQAFSSLRLDCRYALKEMREVIEHYKGLHHRWVETIQYLYAKAESHLAKVKQGKSSDEIAHWKNHFSAIRNSYANLEEKLATSNSLIHDLERVFCNVKPVIPLNYTKECLEKLFALIGVFKSELKRPFSQGESRDLLMSPSSKGGVRSAPVLQATTPQKK